MRILPFFDLSNLALVESASTEHLRHRPSIRVATFIRHFRFLRSILAQGQIQVSCPSHCSLGLC